MFRFGPKITFLLFSTFISETTETGRCDDARPSHRLHVPVWAASASQVTFCTDVRRATGPYDIHTQGRVKQKEIDLFILYLQDLDCSEVSTQT